MAWRRNLHAIWYAELVAMAGCTVIVPIVPLYVWKLGVQTEAQARMWAGVIFAVRAVTMAVFGPIWGALSDRYGRKVMVERAMFSASLLFLLMSLARNVHQLAFLCALEGALTKTSTPAFTLVATAVPRERAGHALGLLQMAIYIGASAGPLLGGLVADSLGYRLAYWVAGVLLCLALSGVVFFVKEDFEPAPRVVNDRARADRLTIRRYVSRQSAAILGSPPLLRVLGLRLLTAWGAQLQMPVLPLFVQAIAPASVRVASVTGLIIGVGAAAGAVGAAVLGRLGDRVGHRTILVVCAITSAVCYVCQSLVRDPRWLLPFAVGTGMAMGGILASVSALLAHLGAEGQEGVIYGVELSVVSIASAVGPIMGSALAVWLGLTAPFLFAGGMFALAGAACVGLAPRRSRR